MIRQGAAAGNSEPEEFSQVERVPAQKLREAVRNEVTLQRARKLWSRSHQIGLVSNQETSPMRLSFESLRKVCHFWCLVVIALVSTCDWTGALAGELAETQCTPLSQEQISGLSQSWKTALKSSNLPGLIDLYSDLAVLSVNNNGAALRGKAAIGGYLEGLLRRHPEATVKSEAIDIGCDLASDRGQVIYRITGVRKGTRMLLGGSYITQYRFEKGAWRIVRQILGASPITADQGLALETASPRV
jgi:hypothetical protein